ncbi:glycosyltransferase family 1 protein [Tilletiaria anomala UBC 951]|uniref:UDP-N-acetylglucosamine transferase subunit ALG13 n=1 Tax=Tilletiaria anomala (strain ATCC 24038 / CBS 436.72 / UBC 951) TaxID=1037660 RepID=A0A066V520_TILAU|nr:glycosyltransferase family 1 protein [Tilletiaria anomala UBC 951]KDN35318.1 glycosyltransferase family 1 protein [Tilletiaria anomala UBC 951]
MTHVAQTRPADEELPSFHGDLNVFITVGSTRFDALISHSVLDVSFLHCLSDALKDLENTSADNTVHVIAQYGNADLAEVIGNSSLVSSDGEEIDGDRRAMHGRLSLDLEPPGQAVFFSTNGILQGSLKQDSSTPCPRVEITLFKFAPNLRACMEAADVVISHAGSGTILEVLRLPPISRTRAHERQLIVVPNSSLMDNHQVELAEALADHPDGPYVHVATFDQLSDKMASVLLAMGRGESKLKPFPAFDGSRLNALIDEEMGFM